MSLSIVFEGKFSNGKKRVIGSFIKTNGLNNSKLYLDQQDALFIAHESQIGNKSFNYCLNNNMFTGVRVYCYYEGKKIIEEKIELPLRKLNKQMIINYIEKANAEVKKELK